MELNLIHIPLASMPRPNLTLPFENEMLFFISPSIAKKQSLLIFEIQFLMPLFFTFVQGQSKWKGIKVSQKYIDSLLTYFLLPTWVVYLCSATVEQPLQVMVSCISVVSYDRCVIHHNFPMTYLL